MNLRLGENSSTFYVNGEIQKKITKTQGRYPNKRDFQEEKFFVPFFSFLGKKKSLGLSLVSGLAINLHLQ